MNLSLFPDVVVNGEIIPSAAIAAEAQNHTAPKNKPGIAWRKAAQALMIRALLLQEARKRGLEADPEELAPGRVETDDEALIRALLDEALTLAPITEEAVRTEWARDPDRYRSAPLWDVSHILCACDPRDDDERIPIVPFRAYQKNAAKQRWVFDPHEGTTIFIVTCSNIADKIPAR